MVRIEEFTHIKAGLNSADSASFASTLALALKYSTMRKLH
jgi:hypothetical protein